MALRVLLADESSTIKKVISLALQDFAVEVKVVHSGVDVVEVAKQFGPDIIFADVLLQKKNGYEVCFDVKADPLLAKIPVVLMWSSFMDLDEKAYRASNANAKLEKPFEVEDLRKLVTSLASKTKDSTASAYLKFPSVMSEPMKSEARQKTTSKPMTEETLSRFGIPAPPPSRPGSGNPQSPKMVPPPSTQVAPPPEMNNWNMDSFEDIQIFTDEDDPTKELNKSIENFSELRLTPSIEKDLDSDENWQQKDLSNFKIEVSDEDEGPFAMMDLGKVDVHTSIKVKKPQKAPGKGIESFPSFDFSDSESLNLELDDTAPPLAPETHGKQEHSSDWNFKLPEHEVSTITGNVVEMPAEYSEPSEPVAVATMHSAAIDQSMIEKIVREQTRDLVEKLVQKILPDIAKQLIQKELDRLLNEENLP